MPLFTFRPRVTGMCLKRYWHRGQCAPPHRDHLRPILIAARDTGLRKGALLNLTWADVEFIGQVIGDFVSVPEGNKYKKRPRKIGITTRLKAEFAELWMKSEKKPDSKIFGVWEKSEDDP